MFNRASKAHKLYAIIKTHKENMPITPEINNTGTTNKRYNN